MGIINSLYGEKIFVDTAPLIHFIEGNNDYTNKLNELFCNENNCRFVTSVITLIIF